MDNKETGKQASKRPFAIAAIVIILVAVCGTAIYFLASGSSGKDSSQNTSTAKDNQNTKDNAATDKDTDKNKESESSDTPSAAGSPNPLTVEDIPEPTLNPDIADATILSSDPEPEVTRKQNQKTFNDCMDAGDYAGAKAVLDSYFATSEYALSGDETFSNYTYYYEKQGLYEDSIRYQLDFLEQNMGLDNIVEGNTRYAHLTELLKYVPFEDSRIQKMQESVNRWKEIQQLLDNNKIDTCISTLQNYMKQGIDGVYAYYYLSQAYDLKPDYLSEAKTYYIFLLKMQSNTGTILDKSYAVLFQQNLTALYDSGKITEENRNFLEDEITADNMP